MEKENLLNRILQNTSCPQGFWGRMILHGMNRFHAPLASRGLEQVDWQPGWSVLDIGCGGGANLKRLLRCCPDGRIYGIDLSEESVAFACRYNSAELGKRCFIRQEDVCSLPYGDNMFDAVTAFETVYFWSPVDAALKEVSRVLRKGGCLLISMEAGDPELGKHWTGRIKGMTIYTARDLERMLSDAGFPDIRTVSRKGELHIAAYK